MIWLPLVTSACALLAVAGLRYREVGLRHAGPIPLSPWAWDLLCLGCAVAAATLTVWATRGGSRPAVRSRTATAGANLTAHEGPSPSSQADGSLPASEPGAPPPATRRALAELLSAFPAFFAALWALLPSDAVHLPHVVAGVAVACLFLMPVWKSRREGGPLRRRKAEFAAAARGVAIPTALVVAAAITVGMARHAPVHPGALLISLVTYPLFALTQLLAFGTFALPRLERLGARRSAVTAGAGLFALAHWPNGPLMLACFAAMLLWARVYLEHPSLPAIALSMGLCATAAAQLLPDGFLHHLRTGPGAVLYEHRIDLYKLQEAQTAELTAPSFYEQTGATRAGWIAALYERVLGRKGLPGEIAGWVAEQERRHRDAIAHDFLRSTEFIQRRARDPALPLVSEEWLAQLASDAWLQQHGGSFRAFIVGLYGEILGRSPSQAELDAWPEAPDLTERTLMVREFQDSTELSGRPRTPAVCVRHLGPLLRLPWTAGDAWREDGSADRARGVER